MIRLFTAIALPETLKTRLSFLQGGVPGARWSTAENLHLTLRFIGEVDEARANDIDEVLSALRAPPFELTLKGAGEFGGRDPHALWIGVVPSDALLRLASKIESALQRMGLEAETRKYTPHVTLARLRDAPVAKVREFLAAHSLFGSAPFAVSSFALYSSEQGHYRIERRYPLTT